MKYIIYDKLFDTAKAELIAEDHSERVFVYFYKTKSGEFVRVFDGISAHLISKDLLKRMLRQLNKVEAYINIFGPLKDMGIEQKIQLEVPYLSALRNAHNVEERIMQCPLPQASVPGVGLIFRVLWDLPTARKSEKDCLTFEDAKRYKEELRKAGELLGISHILNIKIEVYEK